MKKNYWIVILFVIALLVSSCAPQKESISTGLHTASISPSLLVTSTPTHTPTPAPSTIHVPKTPEMPNYSAAPTPQIPDSASSSGDFKYKIKNNQVEIVRYNGLGGAVIIPEQIAGHPVTVVGDFSFFDFQTVTSVVVPDCVTKIGLSAFDNCPNLKDIKIGKGVKSIGRLAFVCCKSLTNIVIGDSVEWIGSDAFNACDELKSVTIGKGLTCIENDTGFKYEHSLEEFIVSPENTKYTSIEGVLYNKAVTKLVQYPVARKGTAFTVPDSVQTIGSYAFVSSQLSKVTLGKNVTTIEPIGFFNCGQLTSISLNDALEYIGAFAFQNDYQLSGSIILKNIKEIGLQAFVCCPITSVIIGDKAVTIGDGAFGYCGKLSKLDLGNSIKSIGGCAFNECTSLREVNLPDSVTSIGECAFGHCSITSIQISKYVTNVGYIAFSNCTQLERIHVDEENPNYTTSDGVLFNKNRTQLLQYPLNKTGEYKIPYSVRVIGDHAFEFCTTIKKITLSDHINKISDNAFANCSELSAINVGSNVTEIGELAFYRCSSLSKITIPGGVSNIRQGAFRGCSMLSAVYFLGDAPILQLNVFIECDPALLLYCLKDKTGYTNPWYGYKTKAVSKIET